MLINHECETSPDVMEHTEFKIFKQPASRPLTCSAQFYTANNIIMEGCHSQTSHMQSLDVSASADSSQSSDSGVFDDKNAENTGGNVEVAGVSKWEERAMTEFNKNRKIIIRNVPPVTYEEIKNFLNGYSVSNISISKKCRHAIVTLVNGDEAEEIVERLNLTKLLDMPVQVAVHPSDNLLCLAHLPLNMDESEFRKFAEPYGALEKCFLMHNEFGQSKGYGFIEYVHNKEKSTLVRDLLTSQKLGSCSIHCDFVSEAVLGFHQLHSRCLLVDHLPSGYHHQGEFSSIFSQLAEPQFCMLLERNGEPLSCGVLEYKVAADAERVQKATHGLRIDGHMIRVTFCAPGSSPSQICDRITMPPGLKSASLLPSPTDTQPNAIPSLLSLPILPVGPQGVPLGGPSGGGAPPGRGGSPPITNPLMRNLLASNPQVLDKFQQVLTQLQSQVWQQNTAVSPKPGLLGVAPQVNPLTNPNLQLSILAVLLASQLQQNSPGSVDDSALHQIPVDQQPSPSLLGNPLIAQAHSLIQSLNRDQGQNTHSPNYSQQTSPRTMSPTSSDGGSQGPAVPSLIPRGDLSQSDFQRLLSVLQGEGRFQQGHSQGNPQGIPQGHQQGIPPRNPFSVYGPLGPQGQFPQAFPQGFPRPPGTNMQGEDRRYIRGNSQRYAAGNRQGLPHGSSLMGDAPGRPASQLTTPPTQMPPSQFTRPPMPPPMTQSVTKPGLLGAAPPGLRGDRPIPASNHSNNMTAPPGGQVSRQSDTNIIPSLLTLPLDGQWTHRAPPPGLSWQHPSNGLHHRAFNNGRIPDPRSGMVPPGQTGSGSNNGADNPLLALMIESRIRQQLQTIQRGAPFGGLPHGSQQPAGGGSVIGHAVQRGMANPAPHTYSGQAPLRGDIHSVTAGGSLSGGPGRTLQAPIGTSQTGVGVIPRPHTAGGPGQQRQAFVGSLPGPQSTQTRPISLTPGRKGPISSQDSQTRPGDQENIPTITTTTIKQEQPITTLSAGYHGDHTSSHGNQNGLDTTKERDTKPPASLSDSSNRLKRSISECDTLHTNSLSTPMAKKIRPLHWVPSPEPSPENDYIGQHSQGLGGHYAESYSKKCILPIKVEGCTH